MKYLFYCLLFFLCASVCMAQHQIDIKTSILDEVLAERVAKTPADFGLKGSVRELTEWNKSPGDTARLLSFNQAGFIVREKDFDSPNGWAFESKYSYQAGRLHQVQTTIRRLKHTRLDTFDAEGRLHTSEETGEVGRSMATFSYAEDGNRIDVKYKYFNDVSQWDVVLSEMYDLTFDERGRLASERHTRKHPEATYGSLQTFTYDPASGFMTGVSYRDDCAGSNSCLDLHLIIVRDKCGNILSESMTDRTVRNATWSYGYVRSFKYNELNDVVKKTESEPENPFVFWPGSKSKQSDAHFSVQYPYSELRYDKHGNWTDEIIIMSMNVSAGGKSRVLEYWTESR